MHRSIVYSVIAQCLSIFNSIAAEFRTIMVVQYSRMLRSSSEIVKYNRWNAKSISIWKYGGNFSVNFGTVL